MNRGLPVLDLARGRDFLVLTKRSAASGDENVYSAANNILLMRSCVKNGKSLP